MEYTIRITQSTTDRYHIDANSPEEAKEMAMSGDYDPFENVDASVDNVEVEN